MYRSKNIEGLVVHSIDFRDYDQLLTLFTREEGVLKLIAKSARRSRSRIKVYPLTQAEFTFLPGKGDFGKCQEVSLIDHHLNLRKQWKYFHVAIQLLKMIKRSQLIGKPAPKLYDLLIFSLQKLPFTIQPEMILSCFTLRLLKHEGILALDQQCSVCQQQINTVQIHLGETYCQDHAPKGAIQFSAEETKTLIALTHEKRFTEIEKLEVTEPLQKKISNLFESYQRCPTP